MKRMIVTSVLNNLFSQDLYCEFNVKDPAQERTVQSAVESVGGVKAYLQTRRGRKVTAPRWYYLFPDREAEGEFVKILETKDLLDVVELGEVQPVKAFLDDGKVMIVY